MTQQNDVSIERINTEDYIRQNDIRNGIPASRAYASTNTETYGRYICSHMSNSRRRFSRFQMQTRQSGNDVKRIHFT